MKECQAKIEELCKAYDCGGHVTLVSKTHGEFRFVLPEWTCLYEEVDPKTGDIGIRVRVKKADGDTHEDAELTAHYLHSMRDTFATAFAFVDRLIEKTDEKWKTEHTPFHKFRPHRKED